MAENRSRYAVLGALTVEPMSGYGVRRFFEQSVGYFWRESYGQIYPMLKQLERDGLVAAHDAGATSRRTVYAITEAGRDVLARWLAEPVEATPPRREILLKLFFAREGPPGTALALLEAYRAEQEARLALYETIPQRIPAELAGNPNLANWAVTISYGVHVTRAALAWCDEAVRTLGGAGA
jgi:DNA-binding PadR family transcriptional regulator